MLTFIIGVLLLLTGYAFVSKVEIHEDVFVVNPLFLGKLFIARNPRGRTFVRDISGSMYGRTLYWAVSGEPADVTSYANWMTNEYLTGWHTEIVGKYLIMRASGHV